MRVGGPAGGAGWRAREWTRIGQNPEDGTWLVWPGGGGGPHARCSAALSLPFARSSAAPLRDTYPEEHTGHTVRACSWPRYSQLKVDTTQASTDGRINKMWSHHTMEYLFLEALKSKY